MKGTKTVIILTALLFAHVTAAEIVYSGQKYVATRDYPVATRFVTIGSPFEMDLNGDGIGDLGFYENYIGSPGGSISLAQVRALTDGAFADDLTGHPKAFQAGDTIGSQESWLSSPSDTNLDVSFNTHGPLPTNPTLTFISDPGPQFVGVQLTLNSETYYGWVEYRSIYEEAMFYYSTRGYGYILGWAYETEPNTSIIAGDPGPVPEPASYGIAFGVLILGLIVRRRVFR